MSIERRKDIPRNTTKCGGSIKTLKHSMTKTAMTLTGIGGYATKS